MNRLSISLASVLAWVTVLSGCGAGTTAAPRGGFNPNSHITVVSREDGSGTRGAFIELFGIETKDAGKKMDHTTAEASITNSTAVMMTTVSSDPHAIGYLSLGSLGDTVQAVEIDGAAPTAENIKNGSYKISRPFLIVTKPGGTDVANDFISYIMSADGQKVVEASGYIANDNAGAYSGSGRTGKIVVAGSSSVTPVMEKLKEAYTALNPDVMIEIQQSDSTTGVTSTMDGICDIGMASRDLKDSEVEKGLTGTVIATDGIVVIVNKNSPVTALTAGQVRDIFTGAATVWSDVAA